MTHEPDRDRALERLLRLPGTLGSHEGRQDQCLDPETLAAWADGQQAASARQAAEAHASTCDRCQAMLAVMVRTADAGSAGHAARGLGGFRRSLRWLVPLTGGALAATLWLVVRPDLEPPSSPVAPVSLARPAEAPAAGIADETKAAEPPPAATNEPAPPRQRAAAGQAPAEGQAARGNEQEAGRRDAVGQLAKAEPGALLDRAAPKPPAEMPRPEARAQNLPGTTVERPAAPPPPPAAAPAAVANREMIAETRAVGGRAFRAAEPVVIRSPDASRLWRIVDGRSLEYSADGGATWTVQSIPPALVLTAGAAPSAAAAWLVGRGGVVLRTTDGRTWQRVAFPATTDLVGVTAADARTATVQAADGRTFTTADGGTTWDR